MRFSDDNSVRAPGQSNPRRGRDYEHSNFVTPRRNNTRGKTIIQSPPDRFGRVNVPRGTVNAWYFDQPICDFCHFVGHFKISCPMRYERSNFDNVSNQNVTSNVNASLN